MPISLILVILPVIFSLLVVLSNNKVAKYLFIAATLTELLVTAYVLTTFQATPELQFYYEHRWLSNFRISISLGIDGINLLFIVLTNFIMFLVSINMFAKPYSKFLYTLLLISQLGLLGVFMSFNALIFYFFWEVALIPLYFVIAQWGIGQNKVKVSFKFFYYTMFGSLLMLMGIIYLYLNTDSHSFDILPFYQNVLSITEQKFVFWLFFIAFAIKLPVFPFHTWQRDTYVIAPSFVSIILSALMLKMGIYAAIRWLIPVLSKAVISYVDIMIVLGLINILYGGIVAIKRKNIKALIAYASLSHVGLMFAGLFLFTAGSLSGVLMHAFNHGLVVAGLFMIAEVFFTRYHTLNVNTYPGGILDQSKSLAAIFLILLLSSIALPLTGGFVGEFMLLNSLFSHNVFFASLAVLSVILAAIYMLSLYNRTMLGPKCSTFTPLNLTELIPLILLSVCTLLIGIYPNLILKLIEPSVKNLLYFIKFIKE